ncbi:hypothetical protein BDF21DRAFT_444331 [Thamnidium elegans]|uniref:PH domain-containing protein n=1 Tax=Thamnidium elegans TaxID=101142 RepID=A0A8H7SEK2_9FUNG|nr:hypothetical protein INT48_003136 [Thamnidium elegans]KAI8080973.1 hypothetical protein BDF21DRAFT_444331 [Thamnidium elegans]
MYSRQQQNVGPRTTDWRNQELKRTPSPNPEDQRPQTKFVRRPLPTTNNGQSVAALQQHHQWLMQQQDPKQNRAVSPIPTAKPRTNDNLMTMKQYTLPHNDMDVSYDEDMVDEGDDVEEERMVVIQDMRSRSPSINRSSGGSIMSVTTAAPSFYHTSPTVSQEFKVVKEGWLYRKNGLMQWKPVYAVAKHGNAVKPGGLYLYKDVKCANHIQTYDMSEVLEISPRAQDYKQGIKWEIRMLVKRDDVMLATDDMLSRKDWVDSLTSIMGKVSIATQNELTSRIQSSEQMNRGLREVAEELDVENAQLKEQVASLKDSISKKDRFYQQELTNRESELKESFSKQERELHQEFEAREDELNTELDRQRQTLETKCEIFEREAMQWRSKYNDLDNKTKSDAKGTDDAQQDTINSLQIEVRKWRNRVDELEHQQKQIELRTNERASYRPRTTAYNNEGSSDSIKEAMSDVKFNLQVLRDQIKNSSEGPLLDIKTNVNKLYDNLEDAKIGWTELQNDIIKFLESEKEDTDAKDVNHKHLVELIRHDVTDLREELVGISIDDDEKKLPSLTEKFDILIEMVENLQMGQSRLSSTVLENASSSSSASSLSDIPTTPHNEEDTVLFKAVSLQQKQLTDWIKESREIHNSTMTTIESNLIQNRDLPSVPTDISRLHDKITNTIESAMQELSKNQQDGQDEQGKNIKVIANYLQLITNDIQNSSIPDIAALSQQLEDVVERLGSTEERLSLINGPSWSSNMEPSSGPPISDSDKLSQLHNFVKNTERFMERSLRILSQYGGNSAGMEETIRRAVKGTSKAQLEELAIIQKQNKEEREISEKKMNRYEENARTYFDKSMEKMHTDLHEFTGVMYEMLEALVIKALEHNAEGSSDHDQPKSIANIVELHGKLSGLNQALKTEIARLEEEKKQLQSTVKEMKKKTQDLEKEIDSQKNELRTIKSEYDRVSRDVTQSRQDSVTSLANDLEPLLRQISKLKKMAGGEDNSEGYTDRREKRLSNNNRSKSPLPTRYDDDQEEDTGRKLRFPSPNMTRQQNHNRRNSFNSESSDNTFNGRQTYDQSSIKSPLMGSRDRPRGKSPLAGYLARK